MVVVAVVALEPIEVVVDALPIVKVRGGSIKQSS